MTPDLTLPVELCGESALGLLPAALEHRGKLVISGEEVRAIDAWGGAVLRTIVEHHARYLQRRVELSLPRERHAGALLHALVRHDHPAHLVLPEHSDRHHGPVPERVMLQAQPVRSVEEACHLSRALFARGACPDTARRFLAKHLPELVANALAHAQDPVTPPVACAFHDRNRGEAQLAVVDRGRCRPPFEPDTLADAVLDSPASATLRTLVDHVAHHSIDVCLNLASGTGRLRWRSGKWMRENGEPVPGFAAAITVAT